MKAMTMLEIEVEGVEHPPGPREGLQFAARITQDFPERIAWGAKPASRSRCRRDNDLGQTVARNNIK
jgi:hypothetical protein